MAMSSNSSPPSSTRSISGIISPLRTAFRDSDYEEAARQLKAREEELKREHHKRKREKEASEAQWHEKCDILDSELRKLKLKVVELENEGEKLNRECEIYDDKVTELARELSVSKEREEKAIKRYERVLESFRVSEREKDELVAKLLQAQSSKTEDVVALREEVAELKRQLREKEEEVMDILSKSNDFWEKGRIQGEAEAEALHREVDNLNKEKVKLEAQLKALRENGEDGRMKELVEKNRVLETGKRKVEGEVGGLRRRIEELEVERTKMEGLLKELKANVEGKHQKINELMEKNEALEADKRRASDQVDVLGRENRVLVATNSKTEVQLEALRKIAKDMEESVNTIPNTYEAKLAAVEGVMNKVEMQKIELAEKNESLEKEKAELLGKINELEKQCRKLKGDASKVIKNLDLEVDLTGIMQTKDDMNPHQEAAEFGMKSEELVRMGLDFDTEVSRNNGAIGIKNGASSFIVLSDSDGDDENRLPTSDLKRKRASSQCSNLRAKDECFSEDSLNSNCKVKKLTDLPHELSKPKPSNSNSGDNSDSKFVTPQKQPVTAFTPLSKCHKMCGEKVKGPLDDVNSQHSNSSIQIDALCSPKARALIAACRRSRNLH